MAVGSFRLPSGGASLIVDFSVDDATPDTNQTITFTDLTVGATSWVWNFGDGTTSSLQNPTKAYKYAGNYTVTLAAENATTGGIETKVGFIVVTLQTIVQTNLQAHYKALVGATPPNATLVSGAISQWDDDTINAYHVTQGSVTARPLYSVTEITAPDGTVYGGATFDGINDFLANAAAGFTRGVNTTLFMLFKQNSIAAGSRAVFVTSGGLQGISTLANNPQFRLSSGIGSDSFMAYPLGNYFVLKAQFSNSGNARVGINNLIDRLISNTGASTDVGIVIGGNAAGSAQSAITFIEGAVYSANPSTGDVTNILNYFKAKFGLWE